jgi:hypothetical protein
MVEFWSIENTGWSGGVSWFRDEQRFDSKYEALDTAIERKRELDQDTTLWRIVHTTIERSDNKEIITRTWRII